MRGFDDVPDPEEATRKIEKIRQLRTRHRETTFRDIPHLWDFICTTSEPYKIDIKYKFERGEQPDSHLSKPDTLELHDRLHKDLCILLQHIPGAQAAILDDNLKIADTYLFHVFMSFAQTQEGQILVESFSKSQAWETLPDLVKSLEEPNFVNALHDVVNIRALRSQDEPRGGERTRDEDFWATFTQPGFMRDICSTEHRRQYCIKLLIRTIKSGTISQRQFTLVQEKLTPLSPEEEAQIKAALNAKRVSDGRTRKNGIHLGDLILDRWLPLVLWNNTTAGIEALLETHIASERKKIKAKFNEDTIKRAVSRLGLSRYYTAV